MIKKKIIVFQKRFLFLVSIIAVLFLSLPHFVSATQYYRVGKGSSLNVNEWSNCQTVNNAVGTQDVFVPTNSSTEWAQFRLHHPVQVTVIPCFGVYRRPITVTNSTGAALTNYQVAVSLNTSSLISAGKMKSDCGDTRFTESDGTTSLNYWIESGCNTTVTTIWVNIPQVPTGSKTIYVYYGNLSLSEASNGTNTFPFFDNFAGTTLDTSKWTPTVSGSGSVTVNNGVTLNNPSVNADSAYIGVKNPGNYNVINGSMAMEFYGKLIESGVAYRPFGFAVFVYDITTGVEKFIALSNLDLAGGIKITNQKASQNYSSSATINGYTTGFARYKFYGDGATTHVFVNGTETAYSGSYYPPAPTQPTTISFGPRTTGGNNLNQVYLSWVFFHKRSAAEPTTSVGSELAA